MHKKPTARLQFTCSPEIAQTLRRLARVNMMSQSLVVRIAISQMLELTQTMRSEAFNDDASHDSPPYAFPVPGAELPYSYGITVEPTLFAAELDDLYLPDIMPFEQEPDPPM